MAGATGADTPRVPQDARWSCHGCGFCCRYHVLGPVEPEVVEGLRAREVEQHWAPAAAVPAWAQQRPTPAGPRWFLAKVDGHCVFLADDNTCAVHARWGAEAKPGFCREYPWRVVRDPAGVAVVVREDCGGYHESSAEAGDPLVADQAAAAVDLPRIFELSTWAPSEVSIADGHAIATERWMQLEEAVLASLSQVEGTPAELVAAVRAHIAAATGLELPVAQPAQATLAYRAALEALRMTMAHVMATEQAPNAAEARFAKEMFDRIVLAQHAHGDVPVLSAATRAHANLLLRSHILGKQVHGDGNVLAGLGRWLLVARAAGVLAGRRGVGEVDVAEWALQFTRLSRFVANRSIDRVLQAARPALVDLVVHS